MGGLGSVGSNHVMLGQLWIIMLVHVALGWPCDLFYSPEVKSIHISGRK